MKRKPINSSLRTHSGDPTYKAALNTLMPRGYWEEVKPWRALTDVYFILDAEAGQVKIGISDDVERRRYEHSVRRGRDLELLGVLNGGRNLERAMHARFRDYRVEGNEWYSAEILPEVADLLSVPTT